MMDAAGTEVMCFGHTHKPYHKTLPHETDAGETRYRYAINIGSVGKPKDGDPRACYVVLRIDPEQPEGSPVRVRSEFIRVAYPVEKSATAVEDLTQVQALMRQPDVSTRQICDRFDISKATLYRYVSWIGSSGVRATPGPGDGHS
ncbi:MAG: helix-turn-helix domain-containing protein [Bacteroidetes bacterium]|jgi:hypothetical protein|nr:helix-turn-helix domain-containing protein [Bacteroidota bacterium]